MWCSRPLPASSWFLVRWPSLPFFQKGLSLHVTPEPQMGMGVYSEVEHQSVKPQAAQKRLSAHRGSAVGGKRRDAAEGEAQPSLQPLNEATVSANSSFLCMGWGWSGSPCLPHGDAVEASTKGDHPVRVYQVCLPVVSHPLAPCTKSGLGPQLRINFPTTTTWLRCLRVGVGAPGFSPLVLCPFG